MLRGIFKFSFPFFKINFYDEYNNLLILKENTEITFSVYDKDESLEIREYYSKNGDVFIYLESKGRNQYENLEILSILQLSVSLNEKVQTYEFLLLNSITKSSDISNEGCTSNPIPNIMNLQSIYYLRTNNELIMNLKFPGYEQQI